MIAAQFDAARERFAAISPSRPGPVAQASLGRTAGFS